MSIFARPWFAVVVLAVCLGAWTFTIGPWGPWHKRAVITRVGLRGETYAPRSVTSPPFSLSGPTTLTISATPPAGSSAGRSLIAAVKWELVPTPPGGAASARGSEGFLSPDLEAGPYDFADDLGVNPDGEFRLRLSATSDSPAAIAGTVTELAGYWHGISVVWIVAPAGVAYVAVTVVLLRRRNAPSPVIIRQRHEFE